MPSLKPEQLGLLIRKIVEAEIRRQLPAIMESVLAEKFIRRLASESVRAVQAQQPKRRLSLEQLNDAGDGLEEEEIPEPMRNSNKGIYHKSPLIHDDKLDGDEDDGVRRTNEVTSRIMARNRSQLLSEDNPLADFYAGTNPIPTDAEAGRGPEISERVVEKMVDPSRMARLLGETEQRSAQRAPIQETDNQKMRALELKRKQLDSQTVTVTTPPAGRDESMRMVPRRPPPPMQVASDPMEPPDDPFAVIPGA